jgi:hypothetical protein
LRGGTGVKSSCTLLAHQLLSLLLILFITEYCDGAAGDLS